MNCSKRVCALLLIVGATVLSLSRQSFAVNNGTEPACSDRRYDGVGLLLKVNNPTVPCSQNISGTCVLIDQWTVLVARHSVINSATAPLPTPGSKAFKVRFRRSEAGAFRNSYFAPVNSPCHGAYTEVFVREFVRPANINMDVLMCRLETPVPWIMPIPAEVDAAAMPVSGQSIKIAGWGYSGPCFRTGSALTLRVASGVLPNQSTGSCCIYLNPCSSPFTTGECYNCPAGGPWAVPNFLDSGSPVLIERPCPNNPQGTPDLRVVGIVSTTNSAWKLSEWNRNGTVHQIEGPAQACDLALTDFTNDGVVNLSDLLSYITVWISASCIADYNESGEVDLSDLLDYIEDYFRGI